MQHFPYISAISSLALRGFTKLKKAVIRPVVRVRKIFQNFFLIFEMYIEKKIGLGLLMCFRETEKKNKI